jgi:hypothetical protein
VNSYENVILENQKIFEGEEGEKVGCCHDSVNEIAQIFFSKKSFVSLCEGKFKDEKQLNQWKKELTQKVSLECMEEVMEETLIRQRIFNLITSKLFRYY